MTYRYFRTAHDPILPRLAGDEIVRLDGMIPAHDGGSESSATGQSTFAAIVNDR